MSEIYPSVRASIRRSVLEALYERPGAWLSTHDLLELVEEAESSGVLARILSDMATTGRLEIGPKVTNARGRACNTWGLSPEWRENLAWVNDQPAPVGQAYAAPPQPTESREDESTASPIIAPAATQPPATRPDIPDYPAMQPPMEWTPEPDARAETRQAAQPMADTNAPGAPPGWNLAESDSPPETPDPSPVSTTRIFGSRLPERWLHELRLRLQAIDDDGDPEIILRINTEGGGAYMTLSTHGKIAFDPGELDFLPAVGTALCQFVDALYPYGVKPGDK